jgi:multidrug efflux pump subunit AcrA (membrane-fusion protein)
VWTLQKRKPVPVPVVIGYSDGSNVEITQGDLKAGDQVITAEIRSSSASRPTGAFGPAFGGGRS